MRTRSSGIMFRLHFFFKYKTCFAVAGGWEEQVSNWSVYNSEYSINKYKLQWNMELLRGWKTLIFKVEYKNNVDVLSRNHVDSWVTHTTMQLSEISTLKIRISRLNVEAIWTKISLSTQKKIFSCSLYFTNLNIIDCRFSSKMQDVGFSQIQLRFYSH